MRVVLIILKCILQEYQDWGHFVPDNIVTNDDLSKLMDTNDEWIQERTGIKERRWIENGSPETSAVYGGKGR